MFQRKKLSSLLGLSLNHCFEFEQEKLFRVTSFFIILYPEDKDYWLKPLSSISSNNNTKMLN